MSSNFNLNASTLLKYWPRFMPIFCDTLERNLMFCKSFVLKYTGLNKTVDLLFTFLMTSELLFSLLVITFILSIKLNRLFSISLVMKLSQYSLTILFVPLMIASNVTSGVLANLSKAISNNS